MRRRLLVAIAGAVAAAVAVVGLGTLLLTRLDMRHRDEEDMARRTTELAAVVAEVRPVRAEAAADLLAPALDADEVDLVDIDAAPRWLGEADRARLQTGESVSDRRGGRTYAAAPVPPADGVPATRVLVAEDAAVAGVGAAGRWFVIAGAATVLVGALVAVRLSWSLAGPIVAAEEATRRIAGGDLAARVPEPAPADDELGRLIRSVNAMAASLERARSTERDFLLSVSHDLRTPLTSIGGWAEALADGTAPDPAAAGRTIQAEAGRLDRLVHDLLDLARLRARAFTLARGPVDLRDVAAATAEAVRPELADAGVTVAVDLPDDPVTVDGDADRLAQIAANLLENAGRHATSRVAVAVRADGATASLTVADDGPGIPRDEAARVFDRLHTSARPAARAGPGTGLGLAIVRELARAMGGDAAVVGAGRGARLEMRLPLMPPSPAHHTGAVPSGT
ncbi:MAG TPA: HAMP domain-containing sensor histidine kinase [Acidimicrobiales bacterium]|nr:HAMP domain-containing sensor histidine kinase [Acidimicrobiales bacterium]